MLEDTLTCHAAAVRRCAVLFCAAPCRVGDISVVFRYSFAINPVLFANSRPTARSGHWYSEACARRGELYLVVFCQRDLVHCDHPAIIAVLQTRHTSCSQRLDCVILYPCCLSCGTWSALGRTRWLPWKYFLRFPKLVSPAFVDPPNHLLSSISIVSRGVIPGSICFG